MPVPQVVEHTRYVEHRVDAIWFTVIVFLTFTLGATTTLLATLSLASTVDRVLSLPVCREVE